MLKLENTSSRSKSKLDVLGKESSQLRKLWHQQVDSIFDKINSLNQSLWEEDLNTLQAYQDKI